MTSILIFVSVFFLSLVLPENSFSVTPPIPTGSLTTCVIKDFQNPSISTACSDCLKTNRPDIRQMYDQGQHTACPDTVIYNHWCNGGLQFSDQGICNGIKNTICPLLCSVPKKSLTGPTLTPTPPATVNTNQNPRGCGILYTSGVPSCWCNNGGGQGLCGKIPLDGPGGCRDLCEKGIFTGPKGYTHCFMMPDNSECASNNDGSYRYCLKRCLPGNPGYSQTVGCQYPNKTVLSNAKFDASCLLSLGESSNNAFFRLIDSFLKGIKKITDINIFIKKTIRVPGLQTANCNPEKEYCTFE